MIRELETLFQATAGNTLTAAVVVIMILGTRLILGRHLSPGYRYLCWLILPLVLCLPDIRIWEWAEKTQGLPDSYAPARAVSTFQELQVWLTAEAVTNYQGIVMWIWAAGAVLFAGVGIFRSLVFWNRVRHERPVTDGPALEVLEFCKQEARVTVLVGLVETALVKGPVLFGFVRPRILLPQGMVRDSDLGSLKMVLRHELVHLKHKDILGNLVFFCLLCIHWFNPLVWMAVIMATQDREEACDAAVLNILPRADHRAYGHVLLGFKGISPTILPNAAGLFETGTKLKRRVHMIISYNPLSFKGRVLAFACVLVLFAVAIGVSGAPGQDLTAISKDLAWSLARADYKKVTEHFDERMTQALSEKKLAAVWEAQIATAGDFQDIREARQVTEMGYESIYLTCSFANGPMILKFVFDDEHRIAGLWLSPPDAQ